MSAANFGIESNRKSRLIKEKQRSMFTRSQSRANGSIRTYLLIFIGFAMIQNALGLKCVECSDSKIGSEYVPDKSGPTSGSSSLSSKQSRQYGSCSWMHPTYIRSMKCASNEDICTKTTIYGARGGHADVVTRACESSSALFRHNPHLNASGNFFLDKCYTDKEFRSPSPPYKYEYCICQEDYCNTATNPKYRIIVLVFHVAFTIIFFLNLDMFC